MSVPVLVPAVLPSNSKLVTAGLTFNRKSVFFNSLKLKTCLDSTGLSLYYNWTRRKPLHHYFKGLGEEVKWTMEGRAGGYNLTDITVYNKTGKQLTEDDLMTLHCSQCSELLRDPYQLINCGHRVCKSCLHDVVLKKMWVFHEDNQLEQILLVSIV